MADFRHRFSVAGALLLLLAGLLQGCATSPSDTSGQIKTANKQSNNKIGREPDESLLQTAGNHAALIELYKTRLQNTKDAETAYESRLKLGQTYLDTGDPESTLFYIAPLLKKNYQRPELLLLHSRALLATGEVDRALATAIKARDLDPANPRISNHLGVIHARKGNYSSARHYFNRARAGLLDDATIKNNLAMLDILEENYDAAVNRLMPLYKSGQGDEKITSNLVFALAKTGRYNDFKTIYSETNSESERVELFRVLTAATTETPEAKKPEKHQLPAAPDYDLASLVRKKETSSSPFPPAVNPAPVNPPVENHILDAPGGGFTIQWMAANKPRILDQLQRRYPELRNAEQIFFQRDGRDWYVLVQGNYASQREALDALKKPEYQSLVKYLTPWARSISGLRKAVKG
ncbi:tetratricopeptide repeat protein [Endozoicomonadaceae bacterium StTr2]